MHGDSGGTISLGNGSSIGSYTEGMKINNHGSIIIPSGDVSILKNGIVSGNLTISSTLQSPLTSLLGVSVGFLDGKLNTGTIGSVWGVTVTNRTINLDSNILINSSNANNSYLQFRCAGNSSGNVLWVN